MYVCMYICVYTHIYIYRVNPSCARRHLPKIGEIHLGRIPLCIVVVSPCRCEPLRAGYCLYWGGGGRVHPNRHIYKGRERERCMYAYVLRRGKHIITDISIGGEREGGREKDVYVCVYTYLLIYIYVCVCLYMCV